MHVFFCRHNNIFFKYRTAAPHIGHKSPRNAQKTAQKRHKKRLKNGTKKPEVAIAGLLRLGYYDILWLILLDSNEVWANGVDILLADDALQAFVLAIQLAKLAT